MSTTSPSSFATSGGQQRLTDQGDIDLNTPVRAVNRSSSPVVWEYARQKHTLMPDIPTYVPYMAMVYWQGDPRAINLPGGKLHEQHRRHQHEHIRTLYGVYENDAKWDTIPLIECYPIDSDVRFETVIHDPDGTSLAPEVAAASETTFLREQLRQMQEQMRVLGEQVRINEANDAAVTATGLDPADLERQATNIKSATPDGGSLVGAAPERKGVVAKGGAVTKDA